MLEMNIAKVVRTRIFGVMLSLLSVIMLGFVGVSAYWLLADYDVLEWKIPEYEMIKETYEVGEPLTYRTAFCKIWRL